MDRRTFLTTAAAGATALALPGPLQASSPNIWMVACCPSGRTHPDPNGVEDHYMASGVRRIWEIAQAQLQAGGDLPVYRDYLKSKEIGRLFGLALHEGAWNGDRTVWKTNQPTPGDQGHRPHQNAFLLASIESDQDLSGLFAGPSIHVPRLTPQSPLVDETTVVDVDCWSVFSSTTHRENLRFLVADKISLRACRALV